MTRTSIRKITVNGDVYHWCIRSNSLKIGEPNITVFKEGVRGQPLYLGPFPWDFLIGPKSVASAINFALKQGWLEDKPLPMPCGFRDGKFLVLPKDMKHTYQLDATWQ